jgi:hypothetical protein
MTCGFQESASALWCKLYRTSTVHVFVVCQSYDWIFHQHSPWVLLTGARFPCICLSQGADFTVQMALSLDREHRALIPYLLTAVPQGKDYTNCRVRTIGCLLCFWVFTIFQLSHLSPSPTMVIQSFSGFPADRRVDSCQRTSRRFVRPWWSGTCLSLSVHFSAVGTHSRVSDSNLSTLGCLSSTLEKCLGL